MSDACISTAQSTSGGSLNRSLDRLQNAMHEDLPLSELIERLRRAGHVWFRNHDLMLLEELIRRMLLAEKRKHEELHK
jgi:hypothetical protein